MGFIVLCQFSCSPPLCKGAVTIRVGGGGVYDGLVHMLLVDAWNDKQPTLESLTLKKNKRLSKF